MPDRVVGLDIGSGSVKATQARLDGKGASVVEKMVTVGLPAGVVVAGELQKENAGALVSAIEEAWEVGKFQTKKVVIGVGNTNVHTAEARIPWMTKSDLDASLRYLVKMHTLLPIDPDESQLDYVVLGEEGDGLDRELVLFLIGVYLPPVQALVDVAKLAKLDVVGTDLSALAALRAVSTPRRENGIVDALVDVGTDLTTVLIHKNGVPRYIYTSSDVGGATITRAVQKYAKISEWEGAEMAKTQFAGDPAVAEAVDRGVASITRVVKQAVDHHLRSDPQSQGLGGVTLTGGTALLHTLPEGLEAEFDVPVHIAAYDPAYQGRSGLIDHFLDGGRCTLVSAGLTTGKRI